MAAAAAVLLSPNVFSGFADAPAAKATTRARAEAAARMFLSIVTSVGEYSEKLVKIR